MARPSSDLLAAAWQKVTIDWWDTQQDRFDLFASDIVIEEAAKDNDITAARSLEALAGIPLLVITDEVLALSEALIQAGAIPIMAIGIPFILPCLSCMELIISLPGITAVTNEMECCKYRGF